MGFVKYTYNDCKVREINLGLDLKGGMNVILEVSVKDIIQSLSNYSQDPVFNASLQAADQLMKNSQEDYLDIFYQEFQRLNQEQEIPTSLASPYIFGNKDLRDKINPGLSDDEVISIIANEADGAIDRAFTVLRARIDKFGVVQPNIQPLENTGRILVELPGVKDPERVKKLLQSTAKLEFWETFENAELYSYLSEVNEELKKYVENPNEIIDTSEEIKEELNINDDFSSNLDSLLAESSSLDSLNTDTLLDVFNPLFDVLGPNVFQSSSGEYQLGQGPVVGFAAIKDTAKVNEYLSMKEVNALLPNIYKYVKFMWSAKTIDDEGQFLQLIAIKSNRQGRASLEGDAISDAISDFDQLGRPSISMQMNRDGARIWAGMTKDASEKNPKGSIAVVLDDYVYSFPSVNEEITGGRSEITGQFTVTDAKDLANILKAGKLPAAARIIQADVVGPSLGKEAISAGLNSFLIALLVVLLYMIFYYGFAGVVSDIALLCNVFFIFGVLASLGAVLSLPGIAGVILTIGMAVDANVLIYERIREELMQGKGVSLAIKDGYNNAYSSIIDANVTTLLTGIILYVFGTGPIKGFATTLIIGILTSLFAAIFITRLIYENRLDKKKTITFSTRITDGAFKNLAIQFVKNRKLFYITSSVIILGGIASLATKGLNKGVDFTGGRSYQVRFDQPVQTDELRNKLADVFVSEDGINMAPEVKTFGRENQVRITTKYLIDSDDANVDSLVQAKLFEGVQSFFNKEIIAKDFFSDSEDKKVGLMQSTKVGPTIADDVRKSALKSILFSIIVIFFYILIRFRRWQFSLGAVAAVFHDVMIVLSVFSIFYGLLPFSLEIDQAFIAAMLTVIGYSINDTVVVFDRIREYLLIRKKLPINESVNLALNSTLSRTINTSLTTFFVLLIIFIFGGEVIRGFMFALMVGIIVGTYSSVCIATPVMLDSIKKD